MICAVCGTTQALKHRLKFNVYSCPSCKLLSSDAVFDHSFVSYDASLREVGLKELRIKNFAVIIAALKKNLPAETIAVKGLEVGSGIGWWLEMCSSNGIACKAIEPEETFKEYHEQHNLDVVYGFYPQAETGNEKYDFIIFNDVFEHIPGIDNLALALKNNLKKDGLLIINIPQSDGFFYKAATLLNRAGITSFLERMWQFNFHSPHMNYFNRKNLKMFVSRSGFDAVRDFKLESLDFKSLKLRIRTDSKVSKSKAFFITAALTVLNPVIKASKPDIRVFFFKNNETGKAF